MKDFLFSISNNTTSFVKLLSSSKMSWLSKKYYYIFLYSFFCQISFGQGDLPQLIKPSPSTSSLFQFQEYPMDYSTGLPQISIPLYTINSGSLSLPISINYHASGRRVGDKDGPVALGWSLSAGGMISRTIHGSPDFGTFSTGTYKFPYPLRVNNLSNYNDLNYLQHSSCTFR